MAPEVFHRAGEQSAVFHQPETSEERFRALQALLACPTASIGTVAKPTDIGSVRASFPHAIAENVYHCGYHSPRSFGAASYFIQRPEGNVLVDSPRFARSLVDNLEAMGGIRYLYLTHRDDVADHDRFRDHFGCDRILHADDIDEGTRGVEIQLAGPEPVQLAPDLRVVPVPGHTKGHTVLLYRERFLFGGDHLAWSAQLGHLYAFRRVCWYSWPRLLESMEQLSHYTFEWVLPGHGRRFQAEPEVMRQQMQQCLAWMRAQ